MKERKRETGDTQSSTLGDRPGNVRRQHVAAQAVRLSLDKPQVARLEQVGRREERVVAVQGVHQRQVGLVDIDGVGQVRQLGRHGVPEPAVGQQARLARRRLDGHALQEGLEGVELGRERGDGVHPGQEAARGRHHEGREGHVVRPGVVQDGEGGEGWSEGAHGWQ